MTVERLAWYITNQPERLLNCNCPECLYKYVNCRSRSDPNSMDLKDFDNACRMLLQLNPGHQISFKLFQKSADRRAKIKPTRKIQTQLLIFARNAMKNNKSV
ncbi:hypothetical protein CEXT_637821 [Caerostris extrusa]|uniref:Uncharacterized protein n=1 Tax=Caerostris extrusa TaxID=172846 RepID=A0AAV4V251_CAEEX|nr:hypothetical protein CEXT_637821 [Caerostris extrusa]